MSRNESLAKHCADAPPPNLPQTFGRIGPKNEVSGIAPDGEPFQPSSVVPAFINVVDGLGANGAKIVNGPAAAGMTFFGQFVDHDVTFDATSEIGRAISPASVRNVRTPALDLDCVYGDGPEASPHLYSGDHEGYLLFGNHQNPLDLPRSSKGTALIGDARNDENHILSQLQGAFICLHNIVMTKMLDDKTLVGKAMAEMPSEAMVFQAARRATRLHYQWLVLNDLLEAFVDAQVLADVRAHFAAGTLPKPFDKDSPVMPLEFSVAAYRFGHATVQPEYALNDDHGAFPLFELMRPEFTWRTADKNIMFTRLFDYPGNAKFQKARPVGLDLASVIYALPFVAHGFKVVDRLGRHFDVDVNEARKLPLRNLVRDRFTMHIASGQQMADLMHVPRLDAPKALTDQGITKTPLWFYCLQEGESHGGKLGPVGGTIVATVLMRLLQLSPDSLLCSAHGFVPWTELGATKAGGYSMGHMLKFVEDNRDHIPHAKDLWTGHQAAPKP
jgi:hypothetical protein